MRQHPILNSFRLAFLCAGVVFFCTQLPHGYDRLEAMESEIRTVTAPGSRLEQVQASLTKLGIHNDLRIQPETGPVLGANAQLKARQGQMVLFSHQPTPAGKFLCQEYLEIDVVFDSDYRAVSQYVGRFHRCL